MAWMAKISEWRRSVNGRRPNVFKVVSYVEPSKGCSAWRPRGSYSRRRLMPVCGVVEVAVEFCPMQRLDCKDITLTSLFS